MKTNILSLTSYCFDTSKKKQKLYASMRYSKNILLSEGKQS